MSFTKVTHFFVQSYCMLALTYAMDAVLLHGFSLWAKCHWATCLHNHANQQDNMAFFKKNPLCTGKTKAHSM